MAAVLLRCAATAVSQWRRQKRMAARLSNQPSQRRLLLGTSRRRVDGRFSFPRANGADDATKTGDTRALEEDALLARTLALFLHPPIGVVADTASLADDEVGGGKGSVDAVQALLEPPVVMKEIAAALLDDLA